MIQQFFTNYKYFIIANDVETRNEKKCEYWLKSEKCDELILERKEKSLGNDLVSFWKESCEVMAGETSKFETSPHTQHSAFWLLLLLMHCRLIVVQTPLSLHLILII